MQYSKLLILNYSASAIFICFLQYWCLSGATGRKNHVFLCLCSFVSLPSTHRIFH